MSLDEKKVLQVLSTVKYPGFQRDIVSAGVVQDLAVRDGEVRFRLASDAADPGVMDTLRGEAQAAVEAMEGVTVVRVIVSRPASSDGLNVIGQKPAAPASRPLRDDLLLSEVGQVIAVASGKGGVGKSTVAVNLAIALARAGRKTGLLDADIYGPSIPLMMGVREQPQVDPDRRRLLPFERFGIRFMSLGFLVDPETAVIWRGPMVMKALEQLMADVDWGDLDVLVVDMPPGTGDAQITMSQRTSLAGAVIVTTPQDVALADAIKGVAMFRKVGVPVLGIVENMSYFNCPHCGDRTDVFGHGGGRDQSERLGVPFLGEVPLDPAIRVGGDAGRPVAASGAETPQAVAFDSVASRILESLSETDGARDGFYDRFNKDSDE
jgi:ATP-binding protein involved in chromosome partitioning